MNVVILAGGLGTRISEETDRIPKPMVKIGELPIICHIINYYYKFGFTEFLIASGYKHEVLHEYLEDFNSKYPFLNISVIFTGEATGTGGRLKLLDDLITDTFMLTYGDGLSNVDLTKLLNHHNSHEKLATVTAVRPPARFGTIEVLNNLVTKFSEKDPQSTGWINGGFFVLNKKVLEYIEDYEGPFESKPIQKLVNLGQLSAFCHDGFWQPMDTIREKRLLQEIWESGNAPWV